MRKGRLKKNLKIRYQVAVKEKEKEACTSYKMKINPRQIFISSHKRIYIMQKNTNLPSLHSMIGDFI